MACSLLNIARFMDPVEPPKSMRELAKHHRWISGEPPNPLSLRSICSRHNHPQRVNLRFLSYNTYLMRVEYGVGKFIDETLDLQGILDCFGLDEVTAVMKAIEEFGTGDICAEFFDPWYVRIPPLIGPRFPTNPLYIGCIAVSGAAGLAMKLLDSLPSVAILTAFHIPPLQLLSWFGIDTKPVFDAKPALEARADEIGSEVARYDLVALCEVWNNDLRDRILKAASNLQAVLGKGPSGELTAFGNGLLVLANRPLAAGPQMDYQKQGIPRKKLTCDVSKLADADLWAKKGVMLTYVDVGIGTIELYSTHLYSGDPLDSTLANLVGGGPTNKERRDIRNMQVEDLINFYNATHQKENVAIIVGDFNINARDCAIYQELLDRFSKAKFSKAKVQLDDWWRVQRGDLCNNEQPGDSGGYTNVSGHDDNPTNILTRMPEVCPPSSQDSRFCEDPTPDGRPGERIDYIFVERPIKDHTFNLDLTRIRRRPFRRANPTDGMEFLSDHLGFEVTFIVGPR